MEKLYTIYLDSSDNTIKVKESDIVKETEKTLTVKESLYSIQVYKCYLNILTDHQLVVKGDGNRHILTRDGSRVEQFKNMLKDYYVDCWQKQMEKLGNLVLRVKLEG